MGSVVLSQVFWGMDRAGDPKFLQVVHRNQGVREPMPFEYFCSIHVTFFPGLRIVEGVGIPSIKLSRRMLHRGVGIWAEVIAH